MLLPTGPQVWERFHLHWLSRRVPLHVVRYEDLLSSPQETLSDLVAFIYVRPSSFFAFFFSSLCVFFSRSFLLAL